MYSVLSGVISEGLITQVLPAASAGASFHAKSSSGKFHGVMQATTPYGSLSVKLNWVGVPGGSTLPRSWRPSSA